MHGGSEAILCQGKVICTLLRAGEEKGKDFAFQIHKSFPRRSRSNTTTYLPFTEDRPSDTVFGRLQRPFGTVLFAVIAGCILNSGPGRDLMEELRLHHCYFT